jgi:hypothetical protein
MTRILKTLVDWNFKAKPGQEPKTIRNILVKAAFLKVELQYKPEDLWIGAYYKREDKAFFHALQVWICFLPCLPVYIRAAAFTGKARPDRTINRTSGN